MVWEILLSILKGVICFLDTNFAQFILLLLTLILTYYIYKKDKKEKERDAAIVIKLQIEQMKKALEDAYKAVQDYAPETGENQFNYAYIWCVTRVFSTNEWEKSRHLIVKHLSQEEIKIINEFYEFASVANFQIEKFHELIYKINEDYYVSVKMKTPEQIEEEKPYIRTFALHTKTLKKSCKKAISLFEYVPLKRLEKIINSKAKRK